MIAEIEALATADQIEVITSPARFMTLIACRRWGKTFTTRNRIISRCLSRPNFKYMFIAPTYSQLEQEYTALANNFGLHDFFLRKPKLKPFPQIEFFNGACVDYRSFERPKNIRSRGYDEICADEIQDYDEEDFRAVITPMIRDRRGSLILCGQFRGHNWYYQDFFLPGQPGPKKHPLYKSWRFDTSRALVYQGARGQEELEIARAQTPAHIWKVEYDCDPAANERACFPASQIDALLTKQEPPTIQEKNHHYIMGLDLGRVRDPSAYVVVDFETGIVVEAAKLATGTEHAEQARLAAAVQRKWGALTVVDTTGGATGGHAKPDEYVRHYRAAIPDMRAVNWDWQNKNRMIESLALAIEKREFQIPEKFGGVVFELKGYEAEYRAGRWLYQAGGGFHDDFVAAFAMANWARKSGWAAQGGQSLNVGLL